MLLSNQKRIKIQGIIKRIAHDKSISLEERIYVEKFAKHNSTIALWLKKANSFRRNVVKSDRGIDFLLQSKIDWGTLKTFPTHSCLGLN